MDWAGLEKHRVDLNFPFLLIKGSKGFLSCAYINPDICSSKTEDACAIVSGVNDFNDMLTAKVLKVSEQAKALGISEGMIGEEALEIFR